MWQELENKLNKDFKTQSLPVKAVLGKTHDADCAVFIWPFDSKQCTCGGTYEIRIIATK